MEAEKPIKSKRAGKEKEKWQEYIWTERQKTPERIENAAKAIGGIISISMTLLVSLLADKIDILNLPHYKE